MADNLQSLEELSTLKPATPETPKYVQKLDKQGRAYATGKRKDAVARVWVKPGAGKIVINTAPASTTWCARSLVAGSRARPAPSAMACRRP